MAIEIFEEIAQNSDEWYNCRRGIVTASELHCVIANGRGGAESKTRAKYMRRLAGEILTEEPAERFERPEFDRGHAMEPEIRSYYSMVNDVDVKQVGFVRNGRIGCSPDGLVGDKGAVEFKSKKPEVLIEVLQAKELPSEHKAQVQGILMVTEREWVDFMAYWPKIPKFELRVHRDEAYIGSLRRGVAQFYEELDALVDFLKSYGA